MDNDRPKLYKVKEYAELYRVSIMTVYNWVREGKVKFRKIGGTVRIYE